MNLPNQTRDVLCDNGTSRFPRTAIDQSIIQRFEHIAATLPQSLALITPDLSLTYDALLQRVHSLAAILPEPVPGASFSLCHLLFSHNPFMVEGLLSALRAGYAYVPLDPTYPIARLVTMLKDSSARVILTELAHLELAQSLCETVPATIVVLDDPLRIAPSSRSHTWPLVHPEAPAYLLYTSGSTGIPKGVLQSNRNTLHFSQVYSHRLCITPTDRLSLFSTYCFDAAVMDIFAALLNGAALLPFDIRASHGLGISTFLHENAITVYHSVPTVFRRLVRELETEEILDSVRLVVLGGEPVLPADILACRKHFPNRCRLINGLGPTESTVTLQYLVDAHTDVSDIVGYVPVGFPVEETEVFVIDDNDQVVGDGEIGQLVYKSAYLANGYLNDPEKTSRSFTPDPRTDRDRVYRSGDHGRRRADGCIEFVGRADTQIKINGIRVELGEIESIIRTVPGVSDCTVVLAHRESGTAHALAAFLTPDNSDLTDTDVVNALFEQIPAHSIPSLFIHMATLPKTPSGKVDRLILEEIAASKLAARSDVGSEDIVSCGVQGQLLTIWKELLRRPSIGINDDFFTIGGDSLDVVQLATAIQARLGAILSVSDIYRSRTIFCLSELILANLASEKRPAISSTAHVLLRRGDGTRPTVFAIHAGNGEVAAYRRFGELLNSSGSVFGIPTLHAGFAPRTMTITSMCTHYAAELQLHHPESQCVLLGWCFGGIRAYEMAVQMTQRDCRHVAALILVNCASPTLTPTERDQVVTHYSLLDHLTPHLITDRFSTASELNLMRRICRETYDDWFEGMSIPDIEGLWLRFLDRANNSDVSVRRYVLDSLIELLPEDRKRAIPRFDKGIALDHLVRYVNIMRSDADAQARYTPPDGFILDVPTLFIGARDEPVPTKSDWMPLVRDSIKFVELEGNHFSLWEDPNVTGVAMAVERFIASL